MHVGRNKIGAGLVAAGNLSPSYVPVPLFYRHVPPAKHENVIAVRIFSLPEGLSCVVSWPLPEPGLRVFSPTSNPPEGIEQALPYAVFLSAHLETGRIAVEMDDEIDWDPAWGELVDMH